MKRGVAKTSELLRIAALLRRDWQTDSKELAKLLTDELKTPKGSMQLWPVQAAALADCYDCGGLFAPIAVGKGKALISILAPVVMEAERPLLLVPAQLREQTRKQVLPEMRKHWQLHDNLKIVGYSELSVVSGKDLLEEIRPDLIVLDEAHSVKNDKAARTRRLRRYLKAHPDTRIVALSGTMTRKSLREYWRILLWALGEKRAPLPRHWRELQDWADALDEDVDEESRLAPGALERILCEPGEPARLGYRRRLVESPGVVATSEEELGTSLRIIPMNFKQPGAVHGALSNLRSTWETPNGDPIVEAVDLWRHARELALGFWYRWDPPAPKRWLDARREWKVFVRNLISRNQEFDSELQVWNFCEADPDRSPEWMQWESIKDDFKPNVVAEWISDFALRLATRWLDVTQPEGGIVWVEHVEFGKKLAAMSGYPYFGAGTKAAEELLTARGPVILSIAAHSEGKNLQHYSRNLVVSPPSSGKRWEQLLGRTHRPGQKADEVFVGYFATTPEQHASFQSAMNEARYIEETIGARQKLLYADICMEG